ncbi:unnamed protein product, partial [Closterium sp. NIES-53]
HDARWGGKTAKEDTRHSAGGELVRSGIADKGTSTPDPETRRIANLRRPQQSGRGLRSGDMGPEVELMRSILDRKRPQKMGGSRMDQGGTSDLHDQANAALSNPILLRRGRKRESLADVVLRTVGCQEVRGELTTSVRVQTQDGKVRLEPVAELETSSVDPRDQNIRDLTLGAQGEDRGVARVVVDNQQEVPLVALSTDAGWAPHVQVESLQRSLRGRERGGVRSGALPPLDAGKTGRSRRGWEGRENPGKTRDKVPGVHATKVLHCRVTKTVVPENGLV